MAEVLASILNSDVQASEIERYVRKAACLITTESKKGDSDEQSHLISDVQDSDIQATNDLKSELFDYMLNEVSKDTCFRNIELETEESQEFISESMMNDILVTCAAKLGFLLRDITNAITNEFLERHNAMCRELNMEHRPRGMDTGQIKDIKKSEIKNLISNGVDPMKIGKYLMSVMKHCIVIEMKKWSVITKSKSKNEEEEKSIPLAKLAHLMLTMLIKNCSEFVIVIVDIHKYQENKYDALCEELKAVNEEKRQIQIRLSEERIKQIEDMKKEAKTNKNYDLLTKIDSMKITKISEDGKAYEVNASDRNRSSIICRYTSRSKRLEILSTRNQLKGKSVNHLQGSAL